MNTAISIFKSISFIALVGWLMYGCVLSFTKPSMATTEQQYNCRYDYNDMCYTRAERPWLFE